MKKGIPQQLNNASDVVGKWESVKASLPDPGKAVLILESDGSWWQGHLDFSGIWQINVRPMACGDIAWHEAEQVRVKVRSRNDRQTYIAAVSTTES